MNNLEKVTLIFALIGILSLIIIINLPAKNLEISQITSNQIGKEITITGKIISINQPDKNSDFKLLTISDKNKKITGICNCKEINNNLLNQTLEITGKIEEYKNNLEISINQINIIK